MLARIKIVTSAGDAIVVPQEALVFDTDKYYAFVNAVGGPTRTPRGCDHGVDGRRASRAWYRA